MYSLIQTKKLKKKLLIDYLYSNLKQHNFWAYRYFFCEFLAFINVTGQIILLDKFFDGTFFTYGIEVMSFADRDQEDRIDPMIYVFPRMTKCTFHKYGTSGNIENHDVLCILPLNIVNEKIYIFIWFWFLVLGLLSFFVILYRFIIIFSPYIRAYVLRIRFRRVKKECIDAVIGRSYVGDWLLFYLLGQNIDSGAYKDVVHELAKKLGYRSRDAEWLSQRHLIWNFSIFYKKYYKIVYYLCITTANGSFCYSENIRMKFYKI